VQGLGEGVKGINSVKIVKDKEVQEVTQLNQAHIIQIQGEYKETQRDTSFNRQAKTSLLRATT
jgi:hypothetical protein